MTGKRANGEGSIFPYRNRLCRLCVGDHANRPKKRKYVYGKTREEVYGKWVQLKAKAAKGAGPHLHPHSSRIPRVLAR